MGCGTSSASSRTDAKRIELQLREDKRRLEGELKILLLGAGESGKSTIAKQFKIINVGNYSEEELSEWRGALVDNAVLSMVTLIHAAEALKIPLSPENMPRANRLKSVGIDDVDLTDELTQDMVSLWADTGIQLAFSRRNEFQLSDNTQYCLDNISKFAQPNYLPTQEDVLHCRVRTTGVIETQFQMGAHMVRLVDVGGQRAERRKWMACFDEVTSVIFCLALSEYDLRLAEDDSVNRMHESMKVFQELITKWFLKTTIILFLNKSDIFRQKIQRVDLSVCFPEYTGGLDYDKAIEFIVNRILAMDEGGKRKRIFPHVTQATDTSNVRKVFDAIRETLLSSSLASSGLA